jgi:hypothetical protein
MFTNTGTMAKRWRWSASLRGEALCIAFPPIEFAPVNDG